MRSSTRRGCRPSSPRIWALRRWPASTPLRETLREAVERAEGHAASELKKEKKTALRVHGRFGEPCPVCGETIQQVVYSGSSFQYCPVCQTGGKKLSDRGMDRLL